MTAEAQGQGLVEYGLILTLTAILTTMWLVVFGGTVSEALTAIAVAIGIPLGIALTRRPRLARPVLGVANVVQTIPSLALFGFLIPIPLLGGIGARTAIVALVVYGILPILQNTHAGLRSVDPAVVEAATLFAVFITVSAQIIGDFGYMLLNPRIRFT